MPRALEPDVTFDVVLESDRDKPSDSRPTFVYRSLTCREWSKAAGFFDHASGLTAAEFVEQIVEVASIGLVGWRNMGIEFDKSKLLDVVTPAEARELLQRSVNGAVPDPEAKKNSESPA